MTKTVVTTKAEGDARIVKAISKKSLPRHFVSNVKLLIARTSESHASSGKHNERNKTAMTRRCELLQAMDPQCLIRYMIAYPPTVWEGGRTMRGGDFQLLLKASKPEPALKAIEIVRIVLRELEATQTSIRQRLANVIVGQSFRV